MKKKLSVALFALFVTLCLTPFASPPLALLLGATLGMTLGNPFHTPSKRVSSALLKGCVVLLGFGMNLVVVMKTGLQGMVLAALTISAVMIFGGWLGRRLGIGSRVTTLISVGTAICGGSAIAAVGSVTEAEEAEMSTALGTIFTLNAVALLSFPAIGHALYLSQGQFGMWSGVAIHDISSVTGAATVYGPSALATATAVKLARSLWIVPITLIASGRLGGRVSAPFAENREDGRREKSALPLPGFILFFLLASGFRTAFPAVASLVPTLNRVAVTGMTLTLFLIGAGLSRETLRSVGWKPMLLGVILWVAVSVVTLGVVTWG